MEQPEIPGTYALVFDNNNVIDNPIQWNKTICFGETTQPAWKRIHTHVGALNGTTTNMSDKYRKHIHAINAFCGEDIKKNLKAVKVFFRPHSITDPEFAYDRYHSCLMEKQAHACFRAIWGHGTPANTRDIPSFELVSAAKQYVSNSVGIQTK